MSTFSCSTGIFIFILKIFTPKPCSHINSPEEALSGESLPGPRAQLEKQDIVRSFSGPDYGNQDVVFISPTRPRSCPHQRIPGSPAPAAAPLLPPREDAAHGSSLPRTQFSPVSTDSRVSGNLTSFPKSAFMFPSEHSKVTWNAPTLS